MGSDARYGEGQPEALAARALEAAQAGANETAWMLAKSAMDALPYPPPAGIMRDLDDLVDALAMHHVVRPSPQLEAAFAQSVKLLLGAIGA